MKLTGTCLARNEHRWRLYQLFRTGRRFVRIKNVYRQMVAKGVPIVDANEFVKENHFYPGLKLKTRGLRDIPPNLNKSHPNWHQQPCLFHRDNNVLVQGLDQAKVFTNTVEIEEGLPKKIESLYNERVVDEHANLVQMAIASALVYDATQVKLPIRKDPERLHWRFSRDYGIPDNRQNYILCNRLLHLCQLVGGLELSADRYNFEDAFFSVPLLRDTDIIQLQMRSDLLLLSKKGLSPIVDPLMTDKTELPDMSPMKYTISLTEENIYKLENIFPIEKNTNLNRVHTAFIHFNKTEVQNLYKTEVLESQTTGRSLMKAFTIAAAQARFLYGDKVEHLPEPIVVQCIQTDAKFFHFSVFQLNTLSWPPSKSAVRNIFWSDAIIPAFEFSGYFEAKPTITSYNPEVFKKMLAFYSNT